MSLPTFNAAATLRPGPFRYQGAQADFASPHITTAYYCDCPGLCSDQGGIDCPKENGCTGCITGCVYDKQLKKHVCNKGCTGC